jgi:hypothetical protein
LLFDIAINFFFATGGAVAYYCGMTDVGKIRTALQSDVADTYSDSLIVPGPRLMLPQASGVSSR